MEKPKILPPTWLLITLIAMLVLRFLAPVWVILPAMWNLLGSLFVLPGLAIELAADQAFHRARTTVRPFEESSTLVTSGLFRISRNPMYLGFVLVLIGVAVLLGALTPCLLVLAFAVLIDRMYIPVEERMLAARFGSEYLEYKGRTGRWL